MIDPRDFDKWSPALRGAFRKGHEAGLAGSPASACPYEDKRTYRGALTWSRSFIKAWEDGWERGDDQRKTDLITGYFTDKKSGGQTPPVPR